MSETFSRGRLSLAESASAGEKVPDTFSRPGCVDCHGDSHAHRNDENNTTPPDEMIPLVSIDAFCRECHEIHDVKADRVVERWLERGLTKTRTGNIVCTDCHGERRLAHRTVRWDRKTGELLVLPPRDRARER